MKGVDRAVFAHGRPADGDYRSKVSEKLAKEGHGSVAWICPLSVRRIALTVLPTPALLAE